MQIHLKRLRPPNKRPAHVSHSRDLRGRDRFTSWRPHPSSQNAVLLHSVYAPAREDDMAGRLVPSILLQGNSRASDPALKRAPLAIVISRGIGDKPIITTANGRSRNARIRPAVQMAYRVSGKSKACSVRDQKSSRLRSRYHHRLWI